jgi:hypothetical protein
MRCFAFGKALAFSFHPTPQPPTPEGQGGLNRGVKRCAVDKARRFIRQGIDPGFMNLEGGNPLREAGRVTNSAQSLVSLGAALIRRRLCGSELVGSPVHPDDLLLIPKPWPLPLAPGGRGASRSEGERGVSVAIAVSPLPLGEGLAKQGVRASPSTPNPTTRPGLLPLPLDWYSPEREGGGRDWHSCEAEGVNRLSIPSPVNSTALFTFNWRPHHG